MTLRLLFDEIRLNLKQISDELQYPQIEFEVSEASKPEFGDITCNIAFLLAKELKKRPSEIASIISQKYNEIPSKFIKKTIPHASGYVNFSINSIELNNSTVKSAIQKNYGDINIGKNLEIVVEHTSVNPNKALHIGHVRNIIIGDTISRMLLKAKYDVKVLNYVDDSGLQVADIIVGFKYAGFPLEPPDNQKFDNYCGDVIYVNMTTKYESDPTLIEKRTLVLKELEEGSSDTAKFANDITRRVLEEQLKTCWRLGAGYDCLNFESQIIQSNLWKKIFEEMKSKDIVKFENEGKNKGCWVIRSSSDEDDKILVRSNGIATYIAKDIPYAAWKVGILDDPFYYKKYTEQKNGRVLWETTLEKTGIKLDFTCERAITVIDSRQDRLQKIITQILSDFKSQQGSYFHLGYESVVLSAETAKTLGIDTSNKQMQMSGRKGIYVSADYVLDILGFKTYEEAKKRNPELDESSLVNISEQVAIGALRYEMLKQDLDKLITFDLTDSLSLEGDTGPYIQYAYARAVRILEKFKTEPNFDISFDCLETKYELNLIKMISKFDILIEDAVKNLSPKIIAHYCYDLAVSFNSFYEHVKVLTAENQSLINARICIVYIFKETLSKALDLLGISSPSMM